jgi:hypothetical protein
MANNFGGMDGHKSYLDTILKTEKGESNVAAHTAEWLMQTANRWHFVAEYQSLRASQNPFS